MASDAHQTLFASVQSVSLSLRSNVRLQGAAVSAASQLSPAPADLAAAVCLLHRALPPLLLAADLALMPLKLLLYEFAVFKREAQGCIRVFIISYGMLAVQLRHTQTQHGESVEALSNVKVSLVGGPLCSEPAASVE